MNTSLAGIRNLLFDLGGVIINLDRQRCVDALTALGDEKADEMLDLSVQRGTLMDLEEGKISPSDFFKRMRQKIGKAVSDEEIVHALNELLIGIPSRPFDSITEIETAIQRYDVEQHESYHVRYQNSRVLCTRGIIDNRLFRRRLFILPIKIL